jgi:hypothetical protein
MLIMFIVSSPVLRRAKYAEKSQNSKLEIRNSKTDVSIKFDFGFSSFDPASMGEILCWFFERCNRPVRQGDVRQDDENAAKQLVARIAKLVHPLPRGEGGPRRRFHQPSRAG